MREIEIRDGLVIIVSNCDPNRFRHCAMKLCRRLGGRHLRNLLVRQRGQRVDESGLAHTGAGLCRNQRIVHRVVTLPTLDMRGSEMGPNANQEERGGKTEYEYLQ